MSGIAAVWRIAEDPARANARGGATPWAPCYRGRSGTRPGKAPIDLMLGSAFAVYGRERLDRLMNEAVGVLAPYVPADSIRRAHRRYGERGAPRDVSRMWRLAMLTLWLRTRS